VRVGPTLEQLLKEYPDDVRIVYKQHPLPMHSQAMIASEAAMAANSQGKFVEMHNKLMENSRQLSRDKILETAKGLGLDMDRFTKDLDTRAHKPAIDAMTKEAMDVGATGTPASFVNGRYLVGAQPYESFKKLVDEALGKSGAPPAGEKKPASP
jgi:protein-disulfide isomerase